MEHTFSAHSRLIRTLAWINKENLSWYRSQDWDTCSLLRHVLFTFLVHLPARIFVWACLVGAVSAVAFGLGAGIHAELLGGSKKPDLALTHIYILISLGVLVLAAAIAVLLAIAGKLCAMAFDLLPGKTSSIKIEATLFKSWKEKHCSRIKIR